MTSKEPLERDVEALRQIWASLKSARDTLQLLMESFERRKANFPYQIEEASIHTQRAMNTLNADQVMDWLDGKK